MPSFPMKKNSIETQKEWKGPKSDSKVTPADWPQSDLKLTQKWLRTSFLSRDSGSHVESLLGHFNSFCVAVELRARPLLKFRVFLRVPPQIGKTRTIDWWNKSIYRASFSSISVSTVGVDGARVSLWRFAFLVLWVIVVVNVSQCPDWNWSSFFQESCFNREAPVRFGYGLGVERLQRFRFSVLAVPPQKWFCCVSVEFNRKGRFRFRFRFLENGSELWCGWGYASLDRTWSTVSKIWMRCSLLVWDGPARRRQKIKYAFWKGLGWGIA